MKLISERKYRWFYRCISFVKYLSLFETDFVVYARFTFGCQNDFFIIISLFFRAAFRQGIVQGDKHVIHPILEWLLKRMPDLKDRAYLARFLVKVDIPAEFLNDDKISDLNQQVN